MNSTEDLLKVIKCPEDYIEQKGLYWRHDFIKRYNSPAYNFDKDFQGRIMDMIKKLNPQHGVLNTNDRVPFLIASRHSVDKVILKFDIKSYYDNINFGLVKDFLKKEFSGKELEFIEKFYFDDDKLRKGLFASPIISEIIGIKLDGIVGKILFQNGWKDIIKYSRYYDDLIFSSGSATDLKEVEQGLIKEISKLGLEPNYKKTKMLWTTSAKILGLRIHNGKIVTPKKYRNKIRVRARYADSAVRTALICRDSVDDIEKAMVAVGTVIGSVEFILKNSTTPIQKYEEMMERYCKIFSKLKMLENCGRADENPLIDGCTCVNISKIKAEALELIYDKRHPYKKLTEDEVLEMNKIAQSIPVVDGLPTDDNI